MSPGPIRFGHQATVSSADGPGSRLGLGTSKNNQPIFGWLFLANEYVIRPTRLRESRNHGNVTTATKIFETQRLQALPPASMQRPTAQRDGGGKFEKLGQLGEW